MTSLPRILPKQKAEIADKFLLILDEAEGWPRRFKQSMKLINGNVMESNCAKYIDRVH